MSHILCFWGCASGSSGDETRVEAAPVWASAGACRNGAALELTFDAGDASSNCMPGSPHSDLSSRCTYSMYWRVSARCSVALLFFILLLFPAELLLDGGFAENNRSTQPTLASLRHIRSSS